MDLNELLCLLAKFDEISYTELLNDYYHVKISVVQLIFGLIY